MREYYRGMGEANPADMFLIALFGSPEKAIGATITANHHMNYRDPDLPPMFEPGAHYTIVGVPTDAGPGKINLSLGQVWDTFPISFLEKLITLQDDHHAWRIEMANGEEVPDVYERTKQFMEPAIEVRLPKLAEPVPVR